MITINSMAEADGQWLNDYVQLLTAPRLDVESGQWRALANYYGMLAIIEVRVRPEGSVQRGMANLLELWPLCI